MKFNPTWPQLALLAVLLAALIGAPIVSPASVPSVTMVVMTIVGALFVNLKSGPVFTVAKGGLIPATAEDEGLTLPPKEGSQS